MIWAGAMRGLFSRKPDLPKESPLPECIMPPESVIDAILNEGYTGCIPAQWVNWAASQINMPMKYTYNHPITIKSTWVLYEGCRVYKKSTTGQEI